MTTRDADTIGLAFAGLVALGGLFGFIKAGSAASLISGLLSGGAMAYGVQNDKRVALATSAILLVVMGRRFLASGKFMPAGLITFLSSFMTFRYYKAVFP